MHVVHITKRSGVLLQPPAAEESLGTEFQRCAARAQNRAGVRREQSLQNLAMADGRYVIFNKAARKNIPQSVIDLIRCVDA